MLIDTVVFCSEHCPNCEKLKELLKKENIPFEVRDIQSKDSLVEMRCKAVFPQEAPVLRINGRYLESRDIFHEEGFSSLVLDLI
jgi:glutaredoxin